MNEKIVKIEDKFWLDFLKTILINDDSEEIRRSIKELDDKRVADSEVERQIISQKQTPEQL